MKTKNFLYAISYGLVRIALYPFSLLSYSSIHKIGAKMGPVLFLLIPKYRKRTLSNLALARDIRADEEKLIKLAEESIGNLLITALEYGKLSAEKNIHSLVTCLNPSDAAAILRKGKGVIFFCGHQANWELFFLEGTSRMPGTAIGQPVKNSFLYNWILSVREKFGGEIFLPKEAVKEGLRALKQGKFLGIVGDQGMPESNFSSDFLGRKARTSTLPAVLSYRTGCPVITATMERKAGKYEITYSDPVLPNLSEPSEREVPRIMTEALYSLQESIKKNPGQWLWQHNRWKQQVRGRIKKPYLQDAVLVILPKEKTAWSALTKDLSAFREIYPSEFLAFFTPFPLTKDFAAEEYLYSDYDSVKTRDYRFKLVFNFTEEKSLETHFLRLAAFATTNLKQLRKETGLSDTASLSELLKKALLHAG